MKYIDIEPYYPLETEEEIINYTENEIEDLPSIFDSLQATILSDLLLTE